MDIGNSFTVEEILVMEIGRLSNIPIPAGMHLQIGRPIAECIENLKICAQAQKMVREKMEQEQAKEPEVIVEPDGMDEQSESEE